jgi:hypothetical protein
MTTLLVGFRLLFHLGHLLFEVRHEFRRYRALRSHRERLGAQLFAGLLDLGDLLEQLQTFLLAQLSCLTNARHGMIEGEATLLRRRRRHAADVFVVLLFLVQGRRGVLVHLGRVGRLFFLLLFLWFVVNLLFLLFGSGFLGFVGGRREAELRE